MLAVLLEVGHLQQITTTTPTSLLRRSRTFTIACRAKKRLLSNVSTQGAPSRVNPLVRSLRCSTHRLVVTMTTSVSRQQQTTAESAYCDDEPRALRRTGNVTRARYVTLRDEDDDVLSRSALDVNCWLN